MTYKQALVKASAYCAYQERTSQDVREKAAKWELEPEEIEQLIADLTQQKFIDETRFAKAYVRGKYSQKRWGRRLIVQGLREKKLSDACIKQGLAEIDPDEYWENLLALARKKARAVAGEPNRLKQRAKLLAYLASKGYESDLANDAAHEALKEMGDDSGNERDFDDDDSDA